MEKEQKRTMVGLSIWSRPEVKARRHEQYIRRKIDGKI